MKFRPLLLKNNNLSPASRDEFLNRGRFDEAEKARVISGDTSWCKLIIPRFFTTYAS